MTPQGGDDTPREARVGESAARNTHNRALALLRAHAPRGRVLDLPCGSGAFLQRLEAAGYEAIGGDIAPHPALRGHAFTCLNMDHGVPMRDASLDAIVSIEGIEHIRRPFDFVAECRRVLRPGGRLVLTTPNISSLRSRWRWFLTGFHNKGKCPLDETRPAPRHHINLLSFPQLRYMLHTQGFRVDAVETNQIKAVSYIYLAGAPLHYLVSRMAFAKGVRGPEHARVTREVLQQMMLPPVLLGESLMLVARVRE